MDPSQGSTVSYLIWCSHGRLGAVPSRFVAEIMRPLRVDKLADAPPFVSGVSLIRGIPTPIVDAGLLISETPGKPARVVVLRLDERRRVGLSVDDVIGIRDLSGSRFGDLPPLLREIEEAGISRLTALDGELIVVLETARIVPAGVWAELEERSQ